MMEILVEALMFAGMAVITGLYYKIEMRGKRLVEKRGRELKKAPRYDGRSIDVA